MGESTKQSTSKLRCLFCSKICNELTPLIEGEMEGAVRCLLLKRQLLQYFIVRQLLDIPVSWCTEMLASCQQNGESQNLDFWFRICRSCTAEKVEKAWKIHHKLIELESEMKSIKESIRNSMMEGITTGARQSPNKCQRGKGVGLNCQIQALLFPELLEPPSTEKESRLEKPNDENDEAGANLLDIPYTVPVEDEDNEDIPEANISPCQQKQKSNLNPFKKQKRRAGKNQYKLYWKYCKLCPTKFKDSEDYENHIAAHEESNDNEGKHDCPICSFPARDDRELELHVNHRHTNKKKAKSYSCKKCNLSFKSWKELNAHIRNKHPETPREEMADLLRCKICQRHFSRPNILTLHKKNCTQKSSAQKKFCL